MQTLRKKTSPLKCKYKKKDVGAENGKCLKEKSISAFENFPVS